MRRLAVTTTVLLALAATPSALSTAAGAEPSALGAAPVAPARSLQAAVARTPADNARRHQVALDLARSRAKDVAAALRLPAGESLVVRDVFPNDDGTTGVRYDRRYRGLEVAGEQVIVRVTPSGGTDVVSLPAVSSVVRTTTPSLTATQAGAAARSRLSRLGSGRAGGSHLVVDASRSPARLAYQVPVLDAAGSEVSTLTVDAVTGGVTGSVPRTYQGSGTGRWDGAQSFETTPFFQDFQMETSNGSNVWDWAVTPHKVMVDADDVWGSASSPSDAVDAHVGNLKVYQYFNGVHSRAGVGGDGNGVPVVINFVPDGESAPWANAQWSNGEINLGAGAGGTHPWSTVDLVGHEFTHGVTEHSAGLVYSGESGGLNEGTSDIFGTMSEFAAGVASDPGDYYIAETNSGGGELRRMDDPDSHAADENCYYSGIGSLDVHHSSGPLNHWFYLLSEGTGSKTIGGRTHSSTACDSRAVTGIGRTKAAAIWYRTLTQALQPNDGYAAARTKSVDATIALYGGRSLECSAVERAWEAIAVTGASRCTKATAYTSLSSTFTSYATASTSYATMCDRWTGGDSTQSVVLPSGNRVWSFADTFLGATALRPGGFDVSGIRNSMVVQSGSTLRTVTGGNTCKERDQSLDFWSRYAKTPVADASGNAFYWNGDAMVVGSNVVRFYWRNVPTADGWWQETNSAVVVTPASTLDTASVVASTPTALPVRYTYGSNPLVWGAALYDDGTYVYVYGTGAVDAAKTRRLYLARVPKANLATFSAWTFRTSSGTWSSAQADAAPVSSTFEPSMSFDVVYRNSRYWLIQHQPSLNGGSLVAHGSTSLTGFGTQVVTLYTPPEGSRSPSNRFVWHYDTRVHDGVVADPAQLIVSYNVNTSAKSIGCRSLNDHDGSVYRPRFVTVPVGVLNADNLKAAPALPASPSSSVVSGGTGAGDQNWYDGWAYAGGCPPLKAGMSTLTGSAASSGEVNLSWTNAGRDMWYWIEGRDATANEAFKRIEFWSTGTTFSTYPVTSPLADGHTFEYRVVPFASGFGGKEAPATNVWRGVVKIALPRAPTGVSAVAPSGTTGQIKVSWTGVTFPAPQVFYQVFYWDVTAGQAAGSHWTAWLGETTRNTTLTLTRGHTYGFYVTAINSAGSSPASSTVTARVP